MFLTKSSTVERVVTLCIGTFRDNILLGLAQGLDQSSRSLPEWFSVADAGCLFRIQDPDFPIPDPGSKRHQILGSRSTTLNLQRVKFKLKCYLSWIRIFYHPGSRIHILDSGVKRHCIPDPDPQHCLNPSQNVSSVTHMTTGTERYPSMGSKK